MRKRELFGVHLRAKKKHIKLAQKRAARPMYGDIFHHHGTHLPIILRDSPQTDNLFRKPDALKCTQPAIHPEPADQEIIQINTMQDRDLQSDESDYDSSDYDSELAEAILLAEADTLPAKKEGSAETDKHKEGALTIAQEQEHQPTKPIEAKQPTPSIEANN
jgi:hypothetical protein